MKFLVKIFCSILVLLFSYCLADAQNAHEYNKDGIKYMQKKNYSNAVRAFERAHRELSDNEVIKQNLIYAYARLAEQYAKKEKWSKAVKYAKLALKFSKSNEKSLLKRNISTYYSNFANQEYQDNSLNKALYNFRRALEYDKDNYAAYLGMGKIKYDQAKLDDALKYWQKALLINPGLKEIKEKVDALKKEQELGKDFRQKSLWYFDVRYEGRKNEELASKAIKILNKAYNGLGNDFKFYPKGKTTLIIYNKQQFQEATGRPDWVAGVYDGIIRIHAHEIKSSERIEKILYHEYTHALLFKKVGSNLPLWLNEGLAQVKEPQGMSLNNEEFRMLKKAVDEGKHLSFDQINKAFASNSNKNLVELAYAQSKSISTYLIQRHHIYRVNLILKNLKNGMDIDAALKKSIYSDASNFFQAWEKWFKKANKKKSLKIAPHD